jgi:hypothetical protein
MRFCRTLITFFKRRPANPSQQCKTTSNNIQDPPPCWILMIFKLKFGGGNLFLPAMTSTIEENNFVGSFLKPLLKKVTPVVGSRMLLPFSRNKWLNWPWALSQNKWLLCFTALIQVVLLDQQGWNHNIMWEEIALPAPISVSLSTSVWSGYPKILSPLQNELM